MIKKLKRLLQEKNNLEVIELISKNPKILDLEDENYSTVFLMIAYSGPKEVFQKAIKLKNNFSFHEAIIAGLDLPVKNYLEHNPENLVNKHSKDGFSPLALAAYFNSIRIVNQLLRNGADPNLAATNPSKVNALHAAVAKENYRLCKILIENGANVNLVQMQNVTPLHAAVHRGNLPLVRLLIENGASCLEKMENGESPQNIAEREGHHKIYEYLSKRIN